jgi:exopolysaccharide biosynthesis polyprenyl glycosylphosphotransferase
MLAFTVFTIVVTFFFYRLYHQRRGESRIDEIYRLFPATAIGILGGAALTAIFYQSFDYPRQILVVAFVMTFCLVELGRLVHGTLRAVLFARGRGQLRVLIVGAGEAGTLILGKIRESPRLGYQVVGFLDSETLGQQIMGIPVIGGLGDLGTVVSNDRIDEVIIALPESSHQELLSIVSQCEDGDVSIKVFPDVFQIMASEVNIGDLSGLPLIAMRDVALRGWRLTLKRIVDVALSALFLLFASPVMMAIAAAIWLDARGRGPVFFVQERMGLDARPFPMIKFRTMVPYAEMISRWTVNDDPRRTPIGKFLRRHHLDELPQFINVLLGHMSIVGPRAEQRMFVEQFRQMVPRYMERHREKAGITGWAQINGQVGDTSIWERTKYDLYYIENWSLWFDFKIMLLTALRLVRDVNAY